MRKGCESICKGDEEAFEAQVKNPLDFGGKCARKIEDKQREVCKKLRKVERRQRSLTKFACQPCVKAKSACDDNVPCSRCERLGRIDQCVRVRRTDYIKMDTKIQFPSVSVSNPIRSEGTLSGVRFMNSNKVYSSFFEASHLFSPMMIADLFCGGFTKFLDFISLVSVHLRYPENMHFMDNLSNLALPAVIDSASNTHLLLDRLCLARDSIRQKDFSLKFYQQSLVNQEEKSYRGGISYHTKFLASPSELRYYLEDFPFKWVKMYSKSSKTDVAVIFGKFKHSSSGTLVSLHLNSCAENLWGYSQEEFSLKFESDLVGNVAPTGFVMVPTLLRLFFEEDWPYISGGLTLHLCLRGPSLSIVRALDRNGRIISCMAENIYEFDENGRICTYVCGLVPLNLSSFSIAVDYFERIDRAIENINIE